MRHDDVAALRAAGGATGGSPAPTSGAASVFRMVGTVVGVAGVVLLVLGLTDLDARLWMVALGVVLVADAFVMHWLASRQDVRRGGPGAVPRLSKGGAPTVGGDAKPGSTPGLL